jgi:DNA-binding MarR family transcriptional regulator
MARRIGDTCLCLDVQRASRAIGRRFDEAFRPLGLNNWQFSLLMTLNRPTPLTVGSLAERLAMDRTTTTANLKPLERRGLLEIRRDDRDARARRIVLTDAGRALLAEAVERWQAANDAVVVSLGGTDLAAFRSGLRTIAGVRR